MGEIKHTNKNKPSTNIGLLDYITQEKIEYFIMVTIRLARGGAKKRPFYGIMVADQRRSPRGKFIERIGFFNPRAVGGEDRLRIDTDRVDYWISKGAQPSDRVNALLKQFAKGPEVLEAEKAKLVAAKEAKKAAAAKAESAAVKATADAEKAAKAEADKAAAQATAAEEVTEAPVEKSAEAPVEENAEAPVEEKTEASEEKPAEAPVEKKAETPEPAKAAEEAPVEEVAKEEATEESKKED